MFHLPVAINFKEVLRGGVDKALDFKISGKWVKPHFYEIFIAIQVTEILLIPTFSPLKSNRKITAGL